MLLPGGRSKIAEGRRPSMRFTASAKEMKSDLAGILGKKAGLFDDLAPDAFEKNDFVNALAELILSDERNH